MLQPVRINNVTNVTRPGSEARIIYSKYRIYHFMNISTMIENSPIKISRLLKAISQPERLKILLAIGEGEACVCHLEAALAQRQVYISQQLIALRNAGVVTDRRDGRFIFYRLSDLSLLELIQHAARITGVSQEELAAITPELILDECSCPNCLPVIAPVDIKVANFPAVNSLGGHS